MSAWIALSGGCTWTAIGIVVLKRARAAPSPGARVLAIGLILLGLGLALGNLQDAAGWSGAVRDAAEIAAAVLAPPGLALTAWGTWTAWTPRRAA